MADLELMSKGIINAINMYSNAMAKRAEMENYYVQKRIDEENEMIRDERRYAIERMRKKQEMFDDPIKQIEFQQYIKENPDLEVDLRGTQLEDWYNEFKNKRQKSKSSITSRFPMDIGQIRTMSPNGGFIPQQPQDWQTAIRNRIAAKSQSGENLSVGEENLMIPDPEEDLKQKMEKRGWIENPNWRPGNNKDRWVLKDKVEKGLSASQIIQKDKRTEKMISTIEMNRFKKDQISSAREGLKNIEPGVIGMFKRGIMKWTDPNNPMFGSWQQLKAMLTDAQLEFTAKTKGSISDKEWADFRNAVANNDVAQIPMIINTLNRVEKALEAEETGLKKSFKKIYGEDPDEWLDMKDQNKSFNFNGREYEINYDEDGRPFIEVE